MERGYPVFLRQSAASVNSAPVWHVRAGVLHEDYVPRANGAGDSTASPFQIGIIRCAARDQFALECGERGGNARDGNRLICRQTPLRTSRGSRRQRKDVFASSASFPAIAISTGCSPKHRHGDLRFQRGDARIAPMVRELKETTLARPGILRRPGSSVAPGACAVVSVKACFCSWHVAQDNRAVDGKISVVKTGAARVRRACARRCRPAPALRQTRRQKQTQPNPARRENTMRPL